MSSLLARTQDSGEARRSHAVQTDVAVAPGSVGRAKVAASQGRIATEFTGFDKRLNARRSYFLLTMNSRMMSERLTTIFLSRLFSLMLTSSANSVSVLSLEWSGQSVGERRSEIIETRELVIDRFSLVRRMRKCTPLRALPRWLRGVLPLCSSGTDQNGLY